MGLLKLKKKKKNSGQDEKEEFLKITFFTLNLKQLTIARCNLAYFCHISPCGVT